MNFNYAGRFDIIYLSLNNLTRFDAAVYQSAMEKMLLPTEDGLSTGLLEINYS